MIDASIYSQIKQPEPDNQLARYGQMLQIHNAQLAGQQGQQAFANQQADLARQNKLRDLLASGADPYKAALSVGEYEKAATLSKAQAEADKAKREGALADFKLQNERLQQTAGAMKFIYDQPTVENAYAGVDHMLRNGSVTPDHAAQLKAEVDKNPTPENIRRLAELGLRSTMTAKDQLSQHINVAGGGQNFVKSFNPVTGQVQTVDTQQVTAPPNNPSTDLVVFDAQGNAVPNKPLIAAKSQIAKSGASNTNVNVAAPENAYNKEISEGLGKSNLALVEAAKGAPDIVRNAQSIRATLKNGAITGTGADVRLAVQKALETAGLVGEGKAANTQELIGGLAKLTLSGVKTSGLGAGNGFTDKDLAFLQSATSANFDSTPANILRVADLSERAARATHAKGVNVVNRWKADPALKNVAQDTVIDPLNLSPRVQSPQVKFLGFE